MTIIDDGRAAGWSISDVTTALIALADNAMLADAANRQTGRDIDDALKRIGL